jgi:phage repressor protein C with HTH and peptisase S24 domain
MGMMDTMASRVSAGETVSFRPHGNSMTPRIMSGQRVTVEPVDGTTVAVGDVVLARVCGVVRLHKVSAINAAKGRVQISNNHGHINGWTGTDKVYGRLKDE